MNVRYGFAVALLAVGLGACSDDPTEPIEQNFEYDVTVSGAVSAQLTGAALFGVDKGFEEDSIFAVVLGQDTSKHMIILARRGTQRPAIGTYPITDMETGGSPWAGIYIVSEDGEVADLYLSEQGQITITESTSTRVSGSVDFTAELLSFSLPSQVQVRIKGTFDAKAATGVLQLQ